MESLHWRGLPGGPVDLQRQKSMWGRFTGRTCDPLWGPTLEQSVPEGQHPVEGTHAGALCEEHQPTGRTQFGKISGGLSCQWERDPTLRQKKARRSPPEEERVAQTMCDDHSPPSQPPELLTDVVENLEAEPG